MHEQDFRRNLLGALAAIFVPIPAFSQVYPSKPITIVVAYPPGGDTDAIARLYAEKLSARVGQPVLVENRGGATGTVGTSYVAKAHADGYTLLFAPVTVSVAPMLLKLSPAASYDVVNDLTPIVMTGSQPAFMVAGVDSGISSLKQLMASADTKKMSYASPGSGSPLNILGEIFNKAANVKFTHVPYKGVAPAVTDLMGGHIPVMFITWGPVAQHVANGRLAALAVAEPQRSSLAPNVPTFAELGYKDVHIGLIWQGMLGPKGMSPQIVKTLNQHFNEILKMPDVVQKMLGRGALPVGGEPSRLAQTISDDLVRYRKYVDEFNIKVD